MLSEGSRKERTNRVIFLLCVVHSSMLRDPKRNRGGWGREMGRRVRQFSCTVNPGLIPNELLAESVNPKHSLLLARNKTKQTNKQTQRKKIRNNK